MPQYLLPQIATLVTAAIPFSLILIKVCKKIFSKHHPKLADIETICTTVIGTLTKENISLKTILFDQYELSSEEDSDLVHMENIETKEMTRTEKKQLQKEDTINLMAITTTLCHYHKIHKLEAVLSKFFKSCAIDSHRIIENYEIISQIPSSEEKKLSTVVAIKKETKEIFAFTKGNPKKILEKCNRILINGKKLDIDKNFKKKLYEKIEKLNKRGEKVIAFAYKPLPLKRLDHYSESFAENETVLLGMVGLSYQTNTELAKYIEEIRNSGIKIYITAGSKERQAVAAANELKIINPHYFESITGQDLEDINDQKLRKMLDNKEKDYIFSELKAPDRDRIINALKSLGKTVALINKKSKIGIREILNTIRYQQQYILNKNKLKYHALSCKLSELILLIISLLFQAPLALSIITIITLDILINTFLELSLYRTPQDEEVDPQVNSKMNYFHLAATGFVTGLILSSVYIWSLMRFGWYPGEALSPEAILKSSTIIFSLLALIQIFSAFNLHNLKKSLIKIKLSLNHYLILTSILSILIIYSFTNFKIFQEYLKTTQLSFSEWQVIIFTGIITIIVEEIRKYLTSTIIKKNEVSESQSYPKKSQE